MSPVLKILAGALLMVLGIFTSITYSTELVNVVQGGIGPLLILVGAFIVWLESDELKVSREEKKQQKQRQKEMSGQQTLQREASSEGRDARETAREIKDAVTVEEPDVEQILDGTVQDVREEVSERNDLDVQELLDAERAGQNRKTLVEFLERRVD